MNPEPTMLALPPDVLAAIDNMVREGRARSRDALIEGGHPEVRLVGFKARQIAPEMGAVVPRSAADCWIAASCECLRNFSHNRGAEARRSHDRIYTTPGERTRVLNRMPRRNSRDLAFWKRREPYVCVNLLTTYWFQITFERFPATETVNPVYDWNDPIAMAYLPAPFRRLPHTEGTSMAALAAVSAVATFLVLSQLHTADVANAVHAAPPAKSPAVASVVPKATVPTPIPDEVDSSARAVPSPPAEQLPPAPGAVRTETPAPAPKAEPADAAPTLRSKHSVALIADDSASLDEMLSDPATIPQLIHDGRLFSAAPGTKVEILERQHNLVHVRLLDGATADRSGWVSRNAISNSGRR